MKSGLILPNMPMPLLVARQRPPRPALSVLYLPGYPPMGSTIYDFSNTFVDSGILTEEELDTTEVDITVSPDATTAIPVGSTIRIDSEQMLVSATGVTLTVTRGYNGTTPATHVTTSTITRKTTNNGTIIGASWKFNGRLWYLDFDGSDDSVNFGNVTALHALTAITVMCWVKVDQITADGYIFGKGPIAAAGLNWVLFQDDVGSVSGRTDTFSFLISNNVLITRVEGSTGKAVVGAWVHLAATWQQASESIKLYINGVLDQSDTALNAVAMNNAAANLTIGESSAGAQDFDGGIALVQAFPNVVLSAAQVASRYNQERKFFGV